MNVSKLRRSLRAAMPKTGTKNPIRLKYKPTHSDTASAGEDIDRSERDDSYGACGAGSDHDSEGNDKSPRGQARSGRGGKAGRPRAARGVQEAKKAEKGWSASVSKEDESDGDAQTDYQPQPSKRRDSAGAKADKETSAELEGAEADEAKDIGKADDDHDAEEEAVNVKIGA